MAELNGEFPICVGTGKKCGSKKGSSKKLKRKLKKMKYKLKYQKKLAKEHRKRCKAEIKLKFTRLLLQNHGSLPESSYTGGDDSNV